MADTPVEKWSRADLLAAWNEEIASKKNIIAQRDNERSGRHAAEAQVKETRDQFADLKKRLHKAEIEVSRLSGYIARVREDDTVREELVTVGDPQGEQRMVPKRKHEYLGNREPDLMNYTSPAMGYEERRKPPKHWIEY